MLFWATATWWIPMLLVLGIWRHGVKRVPFSYNPLYWGLVFPFGMYSVCTYRLGQTLELPFLTWLARGFVIVAISAWVLTFFGLLARFLYLFLLAARALSRPSVASSGPAVMHPAVLVQASANSSSSGGPS